MRFELTTPTLARLCSTPELRPRSENWPVAGGPAREPGSMAQRLRGCKGARETGAGGAEERCGGEGEAARGAFFQARPRGSRARRWR